MKYKLYNAKGELRQLNEIFKELNSKLNKMRIKDKDKINTLLFSEVDRKAFINLLAESVKIKEMI